jgi:tRNA (guanine10-N2)-dimethyltransferase
VAKLFFLLSGEFEPLSYSELKAILEAENYPYTITEKLDQTVRLEASIDSVAQVQRRAGYTRVCAQELFTCNAADSEIAEAAANAGFPSLLQQYETFAVRIRRIKEYSTKDDTMRLERLLGKLILQHAKHAKVNLKTPSKTFYGILTDGKIVFGIKLCEIEPKPFVERRARKKPFFHPSAMNAKLARCMVNLAQAKTGTYVLDPFCGTGTVAIEAVLIGCKAIGIDALKRMAKGAKRNIKHFGLTPEAIILADARQLPLTHVDCVVTDPPYGKSASTLKSNTKAIVEAAMASAFSLLDEGQRICIASPKTLGIKRIGTKLGYKHMESHYAYVHSTLTREVAVFKKEKP